MKRAQSVHRIALALATVMTLCTVPVTSVWAQQDEQRAQQFSANEKGTLNQVNWNMAELIIDGKSYRFDPETVAVFYRNREASLINVSPNARISFQLIDDDYVVAIWVERDRDMNLG